MYIKDLTSLFLDSRRLGTEGAKRKATPKTVKAYAYNMKVFTDWLLMTSGKNITQFDDISRMDINAFIRWLQEQKWSEATKLQILRGVRAFLRWVENDDEAGEIARKKNLKKYLPVIGKTPRRTDIPQTKDLKSFRQCFRTELVGGFRDYVMFCLMLDTGCRVGEVLNLKVNEMRLEEKLLIVDGKSGPRPVAITSDTVGLLKAWMKRRKFFKHAATNEYVFAGKYHSEKLSDEAYSKRLWRLRKKHPELPRITAHSLRHAFATNYLRKGGDMEKCRIMMGHSTYDMLKDYLHISELGKDSLKKELERVSILRDIN